jgi:hypothetical protein
VYQDGTATQQLTVGQLICTSPLADGGSTQAFTGGAFPMVPAATWTEVTETLTVPTGCTTAQFVISQNGGTTFPDIFVDDVFIGQ